MERNRGGQEYIHSTEGLENLYLDDNAFEGGLPANIGSCRNLRVLWLQNNNISGTVPEGLADIPLGKRQSLVLCRLCSRYNDLYLYAAHSFLKCALKWDVFRVTAPLMWTE